MKKFIKESYGILMGVGFLFMLAGRYYPDETSTDNYIGAGFYIFSAVISTLALISAISSFKKRSHEMLIQYFTTTLTRNYLIDRVLFFCNSYFLIKFFFNYI